MSEYEDRRVRQGFPPAPLYPKLPAPVDDDWRERIAKTLDGLPALPAIKNGCGCGCGCGGDGNPRRSAPDPGDTPDPYDMLRRLNDSRNDPLTARETGRQEFAAERAEVTRDGRDLELDLRRFRNPDGGNLSGSAAREIARLTEFRVVP